MKINHNEFLTYPNKYDQIMFGTVKQAFDMGAVAVGATIYFGSDESDRQIQEVSRGVRRSARAGHGDGALVLPAQHRVQDRRRRTIHVAADLTGQANHLGVTIQADIIKQKLPENNGGYNALKFGKTDKRVYSELTPGDHPIELMPLPGRQLLHGPQPADQLRRRISGDNDFAEAVQNRRHQQARRRHGPDLRPQGVPAPDERRRQAAELDPGCLSRQRRSRSRDRCGPFFKRHAAVLLPREEEFDRHVPACSGANRAPPPSPNPPPAAPASSAIRARDRDKTHTFMSDEHDPAQRMLANKKLQLPFERMPGVIAQAMPRKASGSARNRNPVIPRQPQPLVEKLIHLLAKSPIRAIHRRRADPALVKRCHGSRYTIG